MDIHRGRLAKRYARALFGACNHDELERYSEKLAEVESFYTEIPDLREALENPAYPIEQRIAVVRDLAEKVLPGEHKLAGFLSVLVENHRIALLPSVVVIFKQLIDELKKTLSLTVCSAFPLEESEKRELLEKLRREHGSLVTVEWEIDADLLGGMTVRSGDKLYDSSIRGALEQFREQLIG